MTKENWKLFFLIIIKSIAAIVAGMFGVVLGIALAMYIIYKDQSLLPTFFMLLALQIVAIICVLKIKLK